MYISVAGDAPGNHDNIIRICMHAKDRTGTVSAHLDYLPTPPVPVILSENGDPTAKSMLTSLVRFDLPYSGKFSWVQIFAEMPPDPPEKNFVVFIFVGCARRTTPLVRTYVHYVARYAMG